MTYGLLDGPSVSGAYRIQASHPGGMIMEATGSEPADIRAYLRLGDQPLTETWLYQHLPYYRSLLD